MKNRILLVATLTLFAVFIQAQNPVQNLSNYLRSGMLDDAYDNMKIAMEEERYTSEARFWLLRGNLYYSTFRCYDLIADMQVGMPADSVIYFKGEPLNDFRRRRTSQGRANLWEWDLGFEVLLIKDKVIEFTDPANGAYKKIAETPVEALEKARDSYIQSLQLDPRYRLEYAFPTNAFDGLSIISEGFLNIAVGFFNEGDFESAFYSFMNTHNIKLALGIRDPRDTIAGYYAVRSAALHSRLLSDQGKYEESLEIINQAKEINEDDVQLSLSEANTYLQMEEYLKTKELLEDIIAKQPDNAQLYFVVGNIYDELGKDTARSSEQIAEYFNMAVNYYESAIKLEPSYFEALFNLGTIYNNRAVDLLTLANELPFGDENYNPMLEKVTKNFKLALPYLEKAHEVNEFDPDPITMLYSIYLRLDMEEKALKMREKIDALQQDE